MSPATCLYCEAALWPGYPYCLVCGRFQNVHWARTPLLRWPGERPDPPPQPRLRRFRRRIVRWLSWRE